MAIISDLIGHDRAIRAVAPLFPDIHRIHNVRVTSGVGHDFSILLVSQGVASWIGRKFHIDKFFCDRHTIVAAASHFPPTRLFVERAANAARAGEQAHKASFSSNHAHRITLIESRLPEHSIKRHISPTC